MFYWLFLPLCFGGPIVPDSVTPIQLLWNNAGFSTRYIFSFWISTDIESDASVTIKFPSQYSSDLGLSDCVLYRITDMNPVLIPCSISLRTLTIRISAIKAGSHKFQIENILNPSATGSTGVFSICTLMGGSIIDENDLYPSIGIAPAPDSLTVNLNAQGALLAGYSPMYKFQISPSKYYPKNSWIRMIFPNTYTFGSLSCFVNEWNTWVSLSSIPEDSQIVFQSFSVPILPTTLNFNLYGVYNPSVSGTPSSIIVEILRENTYTVLARSSAVSAPAIKAGTISEVQISGSPLMMNTPSTYTFNFLPYNTIPQGGSISVKFPTGYNGLISGTCLSVTGLKPIKNSNTISCSETTSTVNFANFQEVSGQYITVTVQAYNPSVSGNTGNFQIFTYDENSANIDQILNAGYVTISAVQYPEGFSVDMLLPKVDNAIGSYSPLDIFLQSRFYVPCIVPPSTYLYITIDCPQVMVIGTGDISCTFGKEKIIASQCKYDTSGTYPQIQVKTPMTGVDCCPLAFKITTAGVPSGFSIPKTAYGTYKFIIKVYDPTNYQLEEAEHIFYTNPETGSTTSSTTTGTGTSTTTTTTITGGPGSSLSLNFWYLHYTRDAWNVLKFVFSNSVDIPVGGMIEWEFQTSNHSFPRDLGWGLQSYQTQEFSCTYDPLFPDAAPSSIYCEITSGTTANPVYVRMKGFDATVTAGTPRWIHLSNVRNAPYAGFVPYLIMRTIDGSGAVLNEINLSLPALVDLPSPGTGTVTGSSYLIDNPSTEMYVSLAMSAALVGIAQVYIVFPHGYKWNHPNAQGVPINQCAANPLQGPPSYYEVFTQPQAAGILYSQPSGVTVSSPFQTCFKADTQSLWVQNPIITVYTIVNQIVRDYYLIQHGQVTFNPIITFDGALEKHDAFDKNTTNLWRLQFTQTHRITNGGTIQVLLPTAYFVSVAANCYKIVNAGISCLGENFYNSNYHRMSLLGVTDHATAVDLPFTYQLNPTSPKTVFEVWFYATTGFTAGNAKVLIFSEDEDNDIVKQIDSIVITIKIADNFYPYYASMDALYTNYIESYGSEPWNNFKEWGPIKIVVKPNQIFPETNTLYNTFVTVTFPCMNGTQYFTINPNGLIQCRMKTLLDFMNPGYFARLCTFIQGTPGTPCVPDQVTFYTPKELRVDPTLGAPFNYYEIELTTIGVTDPEQNGFLIPSGTGYYRFIVNMNKNEGANIEQAEPLFYVKEDRFTYLYTTSEHKRIGDLNIMMFNFNTSLEIPRSDDPLTPGYLLLEFPFDYTGTGAGWNSDLGTGIPDGGKIDCLQSSANTVPPINPEPATGKYRLECFLKYGYLDYTTIIVKNINHTNVNTTFNLYFGGIVNPSKNLYDFPIRIRTVYENITDPTNPQWVTLDTKLNTYVETSFNIGGGNGQTTTYIQDDYSTVVNPVRFIPGVDMLNVSFNIENDAQSSPGDWIWVQVPPGFILPDWQDPAIKLKVINGSEEGLLDNVFTCVPTVVYTWPQTNLFKFQNCITLTVKNYHYTNSRPPDTPNRVQFYPITMKTWPSTPITFHSLIVNDRRSSISRINKFPTAYLQTSTSCTLTHVGTLAYGYYGATEIYNFQFACPSSINSTGEYIIYFPLEFLNGVLDPTTCSFGAQSAVNTAIGAACSIYRGTELHIKGFTSAIPAGSFVDVNITVKNPAQGSLSNPYTAYRYVIATYNSTSLVEGSFIVLDRTDPAGTAWFADASNPSLVPPAINIDNSSVFYYESFPLPNPGIGPIQFSLSSPTLINQKTGFIVISTYKSIALASNGEIRCVWKSQSNEYLADSCVYAVSISSSLPSTITMYAPTSFNIPSNTIYTVYITTVFADGGIEGISFNSGLVKYDFLVQVYATGGGVTSAEQSYLQMVGARFPITTITVDQWTQNTYTRIRIDLQVSATSIPGSTSVIVVEFPTSSSGLFLPDLGLGVNNEGTVPCQGANSMTNALNCYILKGVPSSSIPTKVIVSGFSTISSGSTYTIEFPKIYNPVIGGDNVQISLVVYALDITSGWPGSFIYYRLVENIYRVKTNTPTASSAPNSPSMSGTNDFSFVLSPIIVSKNDYIVLELSSSASLASSSPVCTDASSSTIACTYYSSSNTVIMNILAPTLSVTVHNIINPFSSPTFLSFYIEHWTSNTLVKRLKYSATSYLPVTVTYPDKTTLYINDVLEYTVQFMPTTIVPSTGSVIITFPVEYPSLPESSCYNLYAGTVSFMSGGYNCVVSGNTAKLTNFDQMAPGKNIVIRVLVQNPSSALTTSQGVKVTTYQTVAASVPDIIESNGDTNTYTIVSKTAPVYYNVPRQAIKSTFITAGSYAPVAIEVSGFGTLIANTGNLKITLNGFGTVPSGSTLVCLWAAKMSRCTINGNVVVVYAPENSNWATYPVVITLTSTNADSIDTVGIQHPPTAGEYRIEVDADQTGDSVYDVKSITYLQVFPNTYFQSFKVTPSHTTANAYNMFKVDITTTTHIPQYGYIRIYFPTQDAWGNTLFADDLGTSLSHGQQIPCQEYPGSAGLVPITTLSCKLYLGASDIAKPAFIEVTNFQAVSAGTSISFVIWKIKNPNDIIPDGMNIEMFGLSVDNNYQDLDYFYSNYVMTITSPIASDPGTPPSPYNQPTITSGHIGTALTISIPLMDNTVAIASGTIYILEVSPQISLSGVSITGCTIYQTLNLIQYNTPPISPAGTYPALSFTTSSIQLHQWASPTIYCYQWSNQVSQRNGNAYVGMSNIILASFTSISVTFPSIQGEYGSGVINFQPSLGIPLYGSVQILYPNDYTLLSTDCGVTGLSVVTNYVCSVAGSTATIEFLEAIPAGNTLTVSTDVLALSDTSSSVTINSFYDAGSTIGTATGTSLPAATVASPTWPMYIDYLPQSTTKTTGIKSTKCKISFKVKPTIPITSSANTYLKVATGVAFTGKANNALLYCTVNNNRVPCYESIANQEFTIYGTSLVTIGTTSWQEIVIYTQGADDDDNGYILSSTPQSNTITVTAYNGVATPSPETRTISLPNNELPYLNIGYLHTTSSQYNLFTFNLKTLSSMTGTTDKIVIEFPLKDYNNNNLFSYDLGTGKASGEDFYIDNYSFTGPIRCILYQGDTTNNYPARIEITGYDAISSGTLIYFDLPKITNPQVPGYNINVALRVYVKSNGVITEEKTIEYLFSPYSASSSTCTPAQPTFSSYITSATSTFTFTCCASQDLIASDIVILEVPSIYPYPSSVTVSGSFAIYKQCGSANWIILKSTSAVACHSGSYSLVLGNFNNPAYEILAGTMVFKAYVVKTQLSVGGAHLPVLTDSYSFAAVSTSIDPVPTSSILPTVILSISDLTPSVQSLLTATISYTGTIPTTGSVKISLSTNSDPYYFLIQKGVTGGFAYSLSNKVYKITSFSAISSPIIINIPVTNPSTGTITLGFDAYDLTGYSLGSFSASTNPMNSVLYAIIPIQSHAFRYLSYSSLAYASFHLDFKIPFNINSATNYMTIEFDTAIDSTFYTSSTPDAVGRFNGNPCSGSCISAIWTSGSTLVYQLDPTGSVVSGIYAFEFSGYNNLVLDPLNSGVHIAKIYFGDSLGVYQYYYTFYWFSPSSTGSSSLSLYGDETSDKSAYILSVTPDTPIDFMFIEFFSSLTSGLGYASGLGTGFNDGNYMSGISENSGISLENCVIRISTTSLLTGVFCQAASSSSTSAHTFNLVNIQNPSSATTGYYQGYGMSFGSSTSVHSFIQGSVSISTSTSSSISRNPQLSTTIVQDSTVWNFEYMVDSNNLVAGDYILIDFTNNKAAYQLSTMTSSSFSAVLKFVQTSVIWGSISSLTPTITMNNPIYSTANNVIKLYSYSSNVLVQVATSSIIVIAKGTISTITSSTPQTPIVPFTVSIGLSIGLPHSIPTGGSITVGFLTSYFSSISCAACSSSLSNADYKTEVTYVVTTSGSYKLLTISNFNGISAGTINIYHIRATCASYGNSAVLITSYALAALPIDQGTLALTVSSAVSTLPGIVLLPRLSLTTGYRIPTVSSVADLNILFMPYTTINPMSSGSIVLTFNSNNDWVQQDLGSKLVCLINNYLSLSCSRSTTTLTVIPSITLNSGTLYEIKITSNNGISDGLIAPATSGWQKVVISSYLGVPVQDQGHTSIPITTRPTQINGNMQIQGSGSPSLLQINLKLANSVSSSSSGAVIIEFPVYDPQLLQTQFVANIGNTQVTGTYFPCEIFTTGSLYIPMTSVVCMLDMGYYSANIAKSTRITVTFTGTLASGTNYIIGLPGITVPSTSRGPDLTVYTRKIVSGSEILIDYQVLRHVCYVHNINTYTTISSSFPSISSNQIMSAGNTYTFSFQPSLPIQTSDIIVFTAKPGQISITTSTTTSLSYNFMYLYLKAGWIVIQPSSLISTGTPTSFTLTNIGNPSYISTASSDYTINLMHWNGLTSVINQGVWKYYYPFNNAIPSPAYGLGTITVSTFGCLTCSSTIESSHEMMFYLTFTYSLNLPTGSTIQIAFPQSTNEFQSLSYNCEGYSSGFSSSPSCTKISGLLIALSGFGTYTSSSAINVYVRAVSPPISITTSYGTINIFYDSAATENIGTANTLNFVVSGPSAVPSGSSLIRFSKSSATISARTGQYTSFKFSFQPSSTIAKSTGTVTIKFLFTQATANLLCKFLDTTNNYFEYISSSCTVLGTVYTITAPINTDIVSGKIWEVELYTYGLSSNNGFLYPSSGQSYILVTAGSNTFEYYYNVIPVAASIGKVVSYCRTVSFSNLFEVSLQSSIPSDSSGGRIEIGFDPSIFTINLGTGTTDGQNVDCISTLSTSSSIYCTLQQGMSTSFSYRPLLSRIRLHNQNSDTSQRTIMIPNIINPSTSNINANVNIRVFTLSGSTETVVLDELIYYVIGTSASNAVTLTANSFLSTENSLSVGHATATFQLSTNLQSNQITSTDSVFWRFPYILAGTGTTIKEDSTQHSQAITLYLQYSIMSTGLIIAMPPSGDTYIATVTWDFSNFENPPFQPPSLPILVTDIVSNGFHVLNIIYNQNLVNHIPGVVSISQFEIYGNSISGSNPTLGYIGAYADFNIIFSIPGQMGTNLAISIDFPASFNLDTYCQVVGNTISPIYGDWVNCSSSGSSYILNNINGYTANTNINVIGWITLPTLVGPHSVGITFYYTYPALKSYTNTYTIPLNPIPAHSGFSMGKFVYTAPDMPVYAGGVSRVYFTITVPNAITMNAGYVNFTFPSSSFTASNIKLTCQWSNGVNTWQASSCVYTTTGLFNISVLAPEYNNIPPGSWVLTISGLNGNTYDGIKFPTSLYKVYNIGAIYSPDGVASAVPLNTQFIKVPKEALATNYIFTYNTLMNSQILWQMTFKTNSNIAKGLPQINGKSYILVYFPTVVNSVNCFANDFGSGVSNMGLMNSFSISNMNSIATYMILGNPSTSTPGIFYVQNYSVDLTAGTNFEFYIPWLYNPVLADVIINFRVEIWEENNAAYEIKVYKEYKYCYASYNSPATTSTNTITYTNLYAHHTSQLKFVLTLTNTITGTDPEEKIVWTLSQTSPIWTTDMCAPLVCDLLLPKHVLIYKPTSTILNNGVLNLYNVPNPDDPNYPQTWTIYVFKGRIIQNKIIYTAPAFLISGLNNYLTVYWRLPDETVPNPYINRHDYYLFRFRPSIAIPLGGKFTIDFPSLANNANIKYVVDKACNPLHGIYGNGGKCYSTSTTQITCSGFQEYDPWMPEIQIECFAVNPSQIGQTNNFLLTIYDSSGNSMLSKPSPQFFTIDYAPTQLAGFYIQWPERTRAPACENRNFADLYVKIVSLRGIYSTGNTLRIYLPTGVGVAKDPSGNLYLECTWRNRYNKTPAEFCNYVPSSPQNYVDVGVTDQQGLVQYGQYTVHVYSRDSVGGLYNNSFILPTFPEWESWYVLATTGSQGDAAKLIREDCPVPFTSLNLAPYSYSATKWNIMDLTFQPSRDVPVGGGVTIEFPTTNELDQIFALDLGQSMDPLVLSKPIGCMVLTGFGSPSPGVIRCTAYKSFSISRDTPAYIKITGHTTAISAASVHSIRLVKFQNPVQATSPILNEQLRVHFNVWTYCATSNYFETDYARYNFQKLLNVFNYTGLNILVLPNPSKYYNEILSNPITTIYTVYTLPLHTSINLGVSINTTKGFVMYEFDPAFTLPTTGSPSITCNSVLPNCVIYSESQWIVWRDNTGLNSAYVMNFKDAGNNLFKSPNYEASYYTLSAYVITNGIWAEEHTFTNVPLVNRVPPTVVITHRLNTLHRKTYDVWNIAITPSKGSSLVVRIDIFFPVEFMWLDSTCLYTGLGQSPLNIYPVSCISDCSNQTCTNHITITNFDPLTAIGTISISIGAMNPPIALTTSKFSVYYYSSLTNTSQIIESWSGNSLVIDNITYPYDYWVEWPTVSIYERLVPDGTYGEIWFRFRSRTGLSSTTGHYQIILPNEFDIAPSATPKCTIYHTDVPFENYPDRWTGTSTHIPVSECLYSNKVIDVVFTGDILRQFYGIQPHICTYLVLTTYPSPVDNTQGYKSALTPGCYNLQFYAMEGSNVLESAFPSICIISHTTSTLQVYSSTVDVSANSIYRVEFTSSSDIPNGYFYMDGTNPGSQGTIVVEFESYQSFDPNLAGQYASTMQVFCDGIQGIRPIDGGSLSCKLTVGVVNLPPPSLKHTPAIITVTNFQAIPEGTFVSLHFPIIKNPNTIGYVPQVTVGIYKTDYQGTVTWIEYYKTFYLTSVIASLSPTQQTTCVSPTTPCSITNSNLRTRTNLSLYFKASSNLTPGCIIVIQFPVQYTYFPTSGISATIIQNPLASQALNTFIPSNIIVTSYPDAKMISLQIPKQINSGESIAISLLNFTNPSYVDVSGYISYYSINSNSQIQDSFITGNIFTIFTLQQLKFSTNPVFISNSFAMGSSVTMMLNASLSVDLEHGSTITISMPQAYPTISNISPSVTCSLMFASACTVVGNTLVISNYQTIEANTNLIIYIYSLLNPNTAVIIPQSSVGLTITSKDSLNRIIAYAQFPSFRIVSPRPVLKLFANITSLFYESLVPSTYRFDIITTQGIPSGGTIQIIFPSEYPSLPTSERCFTKGNLISISSFSIQNNVLTVNTNQDIDRFLEFTLIIGNVNNPSFNASSYTSPFQINTYFGGNQLDALDTSDPTVKLNIRPSPKNIVIVSSQFYPQNEGEVALYTFNIENINNINDTDDISFMVQFPIDYTYQLTPSNLEIYCKSTPSYESCYIIEPRIVVFRTLSPFTATQTMTFSIYSVTNPIQSTTHKFSLFLYNNINQTVIGYDNSINFQILALPNLLNMSAVTCSSEVTHSSGDYIFTFTLDSTKISQNGGIYVDWPGNYYSLFTTSYACKFVNSTDPGLLSPVCTFLSQSDSRTSVVTLSQSITPIGQEIFMQYLSVPTLQQTGPSGSFLIRLFDSNLGTITVRSYPNLTPYSSLQFTNIGYRIFINATEINVYQGSYSSAIMLSLEKPSYATLTVQPVPENSNIGVDPSILVWKYAWDNEKTFTIYSPSSVPVGTYLLTWVKTEQNTGPETREFKPLVNININVLPPGGNIKVICGDISGIPLSGTSLPVKVWIPLPTYESITITLNTTSPQQENYVFINPSTLNFSQGDTEQYFVVSVVSGAVSGYIKLALSGPASKNYYLYNPLVSFETLDFDYTPPAIYSVRPANIGRTFVEMVVQASELVQIHYLVTRKGTQPPTVLMLVNGDMMWADTETYYGNVWSDVSKAAGIVSLTGLTDNTNYVMYSAVIDRTNKTSNGVHKYEFKTLPTYLPAKFQIHVTKVSSIEQVINGTAQALALPSIFLINTGLDPALGITRRLDTSQALYYELTLYINRTAELDKPINYIKNLDYSPERLIKYIPYYDTTQTISNGATEYSSIEVRFNDYSIISDSSGAVYVSISITTDGTIFGVILGQDKAAPDSAQIQSGLDAHNRKVRSARFNYIQAVGSQEVTLNFTGLPLHQPFVVYLTAQNSLPGNPELMRDEYVLSIKIVIASELDTSFKFQFQNLNKAVIPILSLVYILLV